MIRCGRDLESGSTGWRRRAALRGTAAAVAALGLAVVFPVTAGAAGKVAFTIKDSRITENSGMARDTTNKVYWTVNDSGSLGIVYGVDSSGKVKGTLRYNAFPTDVEAVAWRKDRLYVGDIGDNDEKRKTIRVYYFDDPEPNDQVRTYRAYDFRYPDGAHDAETLLVTPAGVLYVATKEAKGGLYRAPENPSREGVDKLTRIKDVPATLTDGVILPGGKEIAYLTYGKVLVVNGTSGEVVASEDVTDVGQAEALTLSLDGKSLLVGGEGKNAKVVSMPVPGAAASASPSASGSSDPGSDEDPEDTAATPVTRQRGTYLAVGLAGVVAVVAGVVVAAGAPAGLGRAPDVRSGDAARALRPPSTRSACDPSRRSGRPSSPCPTPRRSRRRSGAGRRCRVDLGDRRAAARSSRRAGRCGCRVDLPSPVSRSSRVNVVPASSACATRGPCREAGEEVGAEHADPVGEDAGVGPVVVAAQHPQAAGERRPTPARSASAGRPCRGTSAPARRCVATAGVVVGDVVAEAVDDRRAATRTGRRRSAPAVASTRPGVNGTVVSTPAARAACSTATQPPSTMRSARLTCCPAGRGVELVLDRPQRRDHVDGAGVDGPVLLRRQREPAAVGAAALVGVAVGRPPRRTR